MSVGLSILSAGAVTSVGLSLPATSAAIRAAVDNFQETRFIGPEAEPLLGARVELGLPQESEGAILCGHPRLAHMVSLAVDECLSSHDTTSIALLLVLPDQERPLDHPSLAALCEQTCIDHLAQRPAHITHYRQGAFGCIPAIQKARALLDQGTVTRALIVGVDTWLTTPSIRQALAQNRLLTSEKSDGFIPGEGAAALLLERSGNSQGIEIRGIACGTEPATLHSDDPCIGKGLAQALSGAFKEAGIEPHQTNLCITGISGEEYFFNEAAYAWARVMRADQPPGHELMLLASRLGDTGAATGLLALAYAVHLQRIKRLPGPHVLLYLSSTDEQRGAITLSANGSRSKP